MAEINKYLCVITTRQKWEKQRKPNKYPFCIAHSNQKNIKFRNSHNSTWNTWNKQVDRRSPSTKESCRLGTHKQTLSSHYFWLRSRSKKIGTLHPVQNGMLSASSFCTITYAVTSGRCMPYYISISHQVRYTPHSLQLHHPHICRKKRPTKKWWETYSISHHLRSWELTYPSLGSWRNHQKCRLIRDMGQFPGGYVSTFQVSKIPRDRAILQGDVLWLKTCDIFAHATSGCFVVLLGFGVHYAIGPKNVHITYWLCKHKHIWNINICLYT